MQDELQELTAIFLNEADEFVEMLEEGLLSLEENGFSQPVIDEVFRAAHSLKGSSMAVGLKQIGDFTHELENLLLKVKNQELTIETELMGCLLRSNDFIKAMLSTLKEDLTANFDSTELQQEIYSWSGEKKKIEQTSSFGFFDDEPVEKPEKKASQVKKPPIEQIKVSQDKINRLIDNIGEMTILLSVLEEQMDAKIGSKLNHALKQLQKANREVQEVSISLRMLPVRPVFQKLKRIVRDVSSSLHKKIDLVTAGEEHEIDKSILDLIADPLVHIIRNAVDHGIESSDMRQAAGKPETGHIKLSACYENGQLVFYISDDGGGIDAQRLKEKAKKLNLIEDPDSLSTQQAVQLIFHPGFSTKEEVSDISGRGVGMDVVKTNIQQMGGDIEIKTNLGEGTTFRISLPLTFSIIEASIVVAADQRYVIPISNIVESVKLDKDSTSHSTPLGPVINLRGDTLACFDLTSIFANEQSQSYTPKIAIIAEIQETKFAIVVDEIIGRQAVVIKNLGSELHTLEEFSGSTILGDGKPALILELQNLIRLHRHNFKSLDEASQRVSA